ncbi:hypothetical protein A6A08_06950 [Nocardiopsis sp. TSRI0078]|uniref:protein kinase domain-containing protein n=1 Tax=unclassified Nocardiopsis TaxID=2649073 RepID=UPI0009396ABF|nr:protein kinase [Nocardiopsis sp. TSRI0078]OKI16999.1 hypothetical protein A6A08_06950 [Nocardiopsis sp. TSRI0078]
MSDILPWPLVPVGGYRPLKLLGRGGYGIVYLGSRDSGEQAAVKLLRTDRFDSGQAQQRFVREIEQLSRVSGPCVASILDADPEAPIPWIATEYIEGPTLQKFIEANGPCTGPDLYRLAVRTAEALTGIHAAGVIHRDLKPENILLASEGPRVIDFGISRALESTGMLPSMPLGSVGYAAPEQLKDVPLSPRTDVFAWGAVMVFAATGRKAFPAAEKLAWMHQVMNREPETYGVREPLLSVVLSCLDKRPERRPTSARLMQTLVESHSSGGWTRLTGEVAAAGTGREPSSTRLTPTRLFTTRPMTDLQDGSPESPAPSSREETARGEATVNPHTHQRRPHRPHALAHSLARTVTDLARAGLPTVSNDLLAKAHTVHLHDVHLPEGMSFIEELNWACLPVPRGGGLLVSAQGTRWRPADHLLAEAGGPVPRELWFTAAANASGEVGPADVAMNALRMDEYEIALSILIQASEHDDLAARGLLGLLSAQARDYRRAEPLLREVVGENGSAAYRFELGALLHRTGRVDEAEQWYLDAAESGSGRAMAHLGMLYSQRAEEEQAQHWLRQSAESAEDPLGMVLWSFDLSLRGRPADARHWYDRALEESGPQVLVEAGDLLRDLGNPEAEDFYRAAARHDEDFGHERWEQTHRKGADTVQLHVPRAATGNGHPTEPDWYIRQVARDEVSQVFTEFFGNDGPWVEPNGKGP